MPNECATNVGQSIIQMAENKKILKKARKQDDSKKIYKTRRF